MTLNHSKTWPVSTLAVVQLRVDPHGHTYSTFTEAPQLEQPHQAVCPNSNNNNESIDDHHELEGCNSEGSAENGYVLPLSKKHVEIFNKMSTRRRQTVRTDTVSTILDQDVEFDDEKQEDTGLNCKEADLGELEKFHVLALTRIEENASDERDQEVLHAVGRRPSIKVDNWDFIYTEARATKPTRCPIHRCLSEGNGDAAKESLLPEVPLDARKTTTLRRHYYPEGGWGWVVVVCSVLVHVLNHGVQLSCSQLVIPGASKFKVDQVHFAGE